MADAVRHHDSVHRCAAGGSGWRILRSRSRSAMMIRNGSRADESRRAVSVTICLRVVDDGQVLKLVTDAMCLDGHVNERGVKGRHDRSLMAGAGKYRRSRGEILTRSAGVTVRQLDAGFGSRGCLQRREKSPSSRDSHCQRRARKPRRISRLRRSRDMRRCWPSGCGVPAPNLPRKLPGPKIGCGSERKHEPSISPPSPSRTFDHEAMVVHQAVAMAPVKHAMRRMLVAEQVSTSPVVNSDAELTHVRSTWTPTFTVLRSANTLVSRPETRIASTTNFLFNAPSRPMKFPAN